MGPKMLSLQNNQQKCKKKLRSEFLGFYGVEILTIFVNCTQILFIFIISAMLLIYSKEKTTRSPLDSVLNKNDNIARRILENKGLF
jgi:hypothetical protein